MNPTHPNTFPESSKPKSKRTRLRLVVSGKNPTESWNCTLHLQTGPKTPPELWLIKLPSKCADPASRPRRLRHGFYEFRLTLSGPAMPVAITHCDKAQQAQWFSETSNASHEHPAIIAVLAAGAKVRVTVHQE